MYVYLDTENKRKLTAVTEVAGVVLRLVVHSHVIRDVGSGQQLPTDVTRHLLLVPDHVSAQAVPCGEGRFARLHATPNATREHMR